MTELGGEKGRRKKTKPYCSMLLNIGKGGIYLVKNPKNNWEV
jgi:hypothetical protein